MCTDLDSKPPPRRIQYALALTLTWIIQKLHWNINFISLSQHCWSTSSHIYSKCWKMGLLTYTIFISMWEAQCCWLLLPPARCEREQAGNRWKWLRVVSTLSELKREFLIPPLSPSLSLPSPLSLFFSFSLSLSPSPFLSLSLTAQHLHSHVA